MAGVRSISFKSMKNILLFLLTLSIIACGDNPSPEAVPSDMTEAPQYSGNPIIKNMFTADPAALVHDDIFYVYTGHDEQVAGGQGFVMNEWLVFSTNDMINWTNHGARLTTETFTWAKGQAWASHVIEKNGKFYWFVTVDHATIPGMSIGVAVGDSPVGPFRDALGRALVTNDMTTHTDITWDDIDPAVFTDDDGTTYLYWGNTVLKYAKLTDDLTALDGPIETIDLPSFTEGPWVFKKDDLYYLTYSAEFPEVIDYATAASPEGPWQYRGRLNDLVPNSPTNHQAVLPYKGKWYFVYHNGALSGGGEFRRSVCIDYVHFNEDGTMNKIKQSAKGVEAIE
jgi:beta-xylosidase